MHSPEGHAAPSSLREFLRAYAMIVLSILTALAFERAAVGLQDRAAARDSKVRIEHELQANMADLQVSVEKNKVGLAAARKLLDSLRVAILAGKADANATAAIMRDAFPKDLSVNTVTWQREAWDAAIADQSASHLAQADLQHYALIYSEARDAVESFKVVINSQLVDGVTQLELDSLLGTMDAHACALLLMRYITTIQQIDGIEDGLAAEVSGAGRR